METSTQDILHGSDEKRDWEEEIRGSFEKSLSSQDVVEQAIAEEVLTIPALNEFCFDIAPKIAKKIVESTKAELKNVSVRLWSSNEKGYTHVSVIVKDEDTGIKYLVDAAGLLSASGVPDSPLGTTRLDEVKDNPLYGNPKIKQYISPSIPRNNTFMGIPQSEKEMNSIPFTSISSL